MERVWLITNPSSGSTGEVAPDELAAALEARGLRVVGRTVLFGDAMPDPDVLDEAGAEAVLVFAGDGTINAVASALDGWNGCCVVLPGGTMNMLARTLHGPLDWASVVDSLSTSARTVSLPYVEAYGHRAFVAVIAGPVAAWAVPREAVRAGRVSRLRRALRLAWGRTFSEGVWLVGEGRLRHRAVVLIPEAESLEVATIDARSMGQLLRLGWRWLMDDWRRGPGVRTLRRPYVTLWSRRRVTALFDGEPVILPSPATIRYGVTSLRFLALLPEEK
jgi:diacylglycerol kinase family enzyme